MILYITEILNRVRESFGRCSPFCYSAVLLTNFGLSVSSAWSPGLIGHLTIWPSDFQNSAVPSQLASYILFYLTLVLLRGLNQKENLKWNCYTFICFSSINFTFKNTFLFYVALNKIYGKLWCASGSVYKLLYSSAIW